MTESDWLSSTDPSAMLAFLRDRGPVSERKLRLFGLACCRRLAHLLSDPRVGEVLDMVEIALGRTPEPGMLAAAQTKMGEAVRHAWTERYDAEAHANFCGHPAYTLAMATERAVYAAGRLFDDISPPALPRALDQGFHTEGEVHDHAAAAVDLAAAARSEMVTMGRTERPWATVREAGEAYAAKARESELFVQADILRDIFGNPFRPARFDPSWLTEAAVALARGVYEERAWDRMPVLADALEDAGCDSVEVLSHCREPNIHVRGCWVADAVLGRA